MKKNRIILSVLAAVTLAATAISCHDNIYYLIQQEVPQQTGLGGDIKAIVPFKGSLYTSNANLYKKTLKSSSETGKFNYAWNKVKATCNGKELKHIVSLAADDTHLYCYTISWKQDKDKSINIGYYKSLYSSTNGTDWTEIDISAITGYSDTEHGPYSVSSVILFDNKEGDGTLTTISGRHAYVRLVANQKGGSTDAKVYSLSGGTVGSAVTTNNAGKSTKRAIKIGGTDFFFNANDAISSSTYGYYTSGSSLIQTNGTTTLKKVELNSGTIYSLALAKDYILMGTSSGIYRVAIDSVSGNPAGSVSEFKNNAQTLLTSRVQSVYVLDSSKKESSTDEYAAMAIYGYLSSSADSFDETGLYAYYPNRGNWNRDGD